MRTESIDRDDLNHLRSLRINLLRHVTSNGENKIFFLNPHINKAISIYTNVFLIFSLHTSIHMNINNNNNNHKKQHSCKICIDLFFFCSSDVPIFFIFSYSKSKIIKYTTDLYPLRYWSLLFGFFYEKNKGEL